MAAPRKRYTAAEARALILDDTDSDDNLNLDSDGEENDIDPDFDIASDDGGDFIDSADDQSGVESNHDDSNDDMLSVHSMHDNASGSGSGTDHGASDNDSDTPQPAKRARGRGRGRPRGQGRGRAQAQAAPPAQAAPVARGRRGRGRGQQAAGRRGRPRGPHANQPPAMQWREVTNNDPGPTRQHRFTPTHDPGPRNVNNFQGPADFFFALMTDDILQYLVDETNQYAAEKIAQGNLKPHSRLGDWQDIDVNEMKVFIGIILNMGIIKASSVDAYWNTKWEFNIPFFRQAMFRNRFQLIYHTMLHAAHRDPNNPARGDKIQPLLNMLLAKFQEYYIPFEHISSDESMIGFKGRVIFRQYIPKKPTKWGILARTLADSCTGYMLNIHLYYGANNDPEPDDGLTKTSRAVVNLAEPYLDKGYHVYADRLYNSVALTQALDNRRTYLTGTILPNRKNLPPQLRAAMNAGEIRAFRHDNLMVLNWKDKRLVTVISSCYKGDETVMVNVRGRAEQQVRKPQVVTRYNEFMGGVDLCDQYNQYHSFCRRSLKWWKKVFFWLIEVCVTNSFILYKLTRPPPVPGQPVVRYTRLKFRKALVSALVPKPADPPRVGRPSDGPPLQRLNNTFHVLELSRTKTDCRVCSDRSRGVRHETLWICTTCTDRPHLHPGNCYVRYHTVRDYKTVPNNPRQ